MGADWLRVLSVKDASGQVVVYQAPAYMEIRDGLFPTSPLVARLDNTGSADGSITFNALAGTVILTMSDEETRTLKPGKFYYDLFVTGSGGLSVKLVYGQVTIRQNTSTP